MLSHEFRFTICLVVLLSILPAMSSATQVIPYLPTTIDTAYDLQWRLTLDRPLAVALPVSIENANGRGYRFIFTQGTVRWESVGEFGGQEQTVPFTVTTGKTYTFTLKRRAGMVALLCDHRVILVAPMPEAARGTLAFGTPPAGVTLSGISYQRVEPCRFGDDFMRPEVADDSQISWVSDPVWRVAYYQRDYPEQYLEQHKTDTPQYNPWQLTLYPGVEATTTNGFWLLYTGTGPSWVVPDRLQMSADADRYYVQAAVYPDYDSAVGLIAAYQDNRNYLLFRWRPIDHETEHAVRAELLAVVDGVSTVLATSPHGFDPAQWYTLRLNLSWQRIQACIDGETIFDVPNPGPAEGRIGLYADGAAHPRRPRVDTLTAAMYVRTDEKTGVIYNDAADAMREVSYILFDDVQVGPWETVDNLAHSPYAVTQTGAWSVSPEGELYASTLGRWVTGTPDTSRYTFTAQVWLPASGMAGILLQHDAAHSGYIWQLTEQDQRLSPIRGSAYEPAVDHCTSGIPRETWVDLRVEVDGAYLACYYQGQRVLEAYDPTRTNGRCGVLAGSPGVRFRACRVEPSTSAWHAPRIHGGFATDRWISTWASAEADWVPAVLPATQRWTPLGDTHEAIGAAAPYPTNEPGLYWRKGGYYHDVAVTIPLTRQTIANQVLYLTAAEDIEHGYRFCFTQQDNGGRITLSRNGEEIARTAFPLADDAQILVERRGAFLLVHAQTLDSVDCAAGPEVLASDLICCYRDADPLVASQIGYTVTTPAVPAAALTILSDRVQETFEEAPVDWRTDHGIWRVMARYSCQPQWNWFGGFGAGTPAAWGKYRLDGDQDVEAYLGVKMQYDDMREDEAHRFRDLNLSICADGQDVKSGYTVMRATRHDGTVVTLLLRNGEIVQQSSALADLLPTELIGHRQWFATRLVKHGNTLRVYLDNRLTMTYMDPEPLPGGYPVIWTIDNGILIGRVNYSADRFEQGCP